MVIVQARGKHHGDSEHTEDYESTAEDAEDQSGKIQ